MGLYIWDDIINVDVSYSSGVGVGVEASLGLGIHILSTVEYGGAVMKRLNFLLRKTPTLVLAPLFLFFSYTIFISINNLTTLHLINFIHV